jgi:hypothetical protein
MTSLAESASVPPPPPPHRKGWWERNIIWVVIGGSLLVVAAGAAVIGSIVFLVFGLLKSSDAYQIAVQAAQNDPRVIAQLGEPIRPGWWMSGSVETSGSSGSADLQIPISGPQGSATVYAVAERRGGAWTFQVLACDVKETGERIPLRPAGGANPVAW